MQHVTPTMIIIEPISCEFRLTITHPRLVRRLCSLETLPYSIASGVLYCVKFVLSGFSRGGSPVAVDPADRGRSAGGSVAGI